MEVRGGLADIGNGTGQGNGLLVRRLAESDAESKRGPIAAKARATLRAPRRSSLEFEFEPRARYHAPADQSG